MRRSHRLKVYSTKPCHHHDLPDDSGVCSRSNGWIFMTGIRFLALERKVTDW